MDVPQLVRVTSNPHLPQKKLEILIAETTYIKDGRCMFLIDGEGCSQSLCFSFYNWSHLHTHVFSYLNVNLPVPDSYGPQFENAAQRHPSEVLNYALLLMVTSTFVLPKLCNIELFDGHYAYPFVDPKLSQRFVEAFEPDRPGLLLFSAPGKGAKRVPLPAVW